MSNLALPGSPRYQPKRLVPIMGYDNLMRPAVEVELAGLRTLAEMGVVPAADIALLTPEIEARLLAITTTEVDVIERKHTKHDVRALVRRMQEIVPEPLRRWIHVPFTSYDILDTARAIMFSRAHTDVVRPLVCLLVGHLRTKTAEFAGHVQIGRTHGQHALPITVGFWLATILSRLLSNIVEADRSALGLVGKISGAVGAYNAQVALGMTVGTGPSFEERVLGRLGLKPARISTQIVPPEPLAHYLFACTLLSATLAQFGRDARHLMRSEIGEIGEPFEEGQVGSSTMAHKRNPMNFENEEGMYVRTSAEFAKVLGTLVSEHQRDLVGSSVARDFPIIVVNLVQQLETLLRAPKEGGLPFVRRITVDRTACKRNLGLQGDRILAEPIYLLLQMYGFTGDAHHVVNHMALPRVGSQVDTLYDAIGLVAEEHEDVANAWAAIPAEFKTLLRDAGSYTGLAAKKARDICEVADQFLDSAS